MITVKEVFEKAYGEIPEGATCRVGCERVWGGVDYFHAIEISGSVYTGNSWNDYVDDAIGPDISDRPAESFRGFFGDEYEAALDALIAESKHPLNDVKFSDATHSQFVTFFESKGFLFQLGFAYRDFERLCVTVNGAGCVRLEDDQSIAFLAKYCTTFREAAEAIAALENALGRFGE